MKRILIFFATIIILAAGTYAVNEYINTRVFVTNYSFEHEEVPQNFDGYKIMLITDLHNAPFSEQISEKISTNRPDAVIIAGDMIQLPDTDLSETIKIAENAGDIPIYAVSGNHDTQSGSYAQIKEQLKNAGIRCLDDDCTSITRDGEAILLIGLKDPVEDIISSEKLEKKKAHIKKSFPDGPSFSIVLNHRADMYPELKDTGADLILSGHLHGGIIRLPFAGGLISHYPETEFFPDYEYGMYNEENAATMIVSGGCDKNPEKKRFFNPPEIVMITLNKRN